MSVYRRRSIRYFIPFFTALLLARGASAQWVQFSDETVSRLNVSDPSLVLDDPEEKDYGWADFDQDGDVDLVIVRKEPYITSGPLPNVLLLNENGVLTDRTAEFAGASDFPGDQGFLTPTNDRRVEIVDLDLDGWLDLVTAPTLSFGEPKHIGHPRIYMNLGCSGACNGTADWLGFEYQDQRIPELLSWSGQSGFNPCLCHVAPGDVNGDDYPDLLLVDYDLGCGQPGADFNSRLLINKGAADPGVFVDETLSRFLGTVGGQPFPVNVDSLSGFIADLNNDGVNEVILESEGVIDIAYNDPSDEGYFAEYDSPNAFSTYFMSVADLNNDGLLDMIATDDAADRYFLNQGPQGAGIPKADFISYTYSFNHTGSGGPPTDDGFGDNTIAADLDRDGWPDVLTMDADFELEGCGRRANIYRNLGGQPGDQVVLEEQTTGSGCQTFFGNPPTCLSASIPVSELEGTFDIATFDINGDGWLDLVVGRCAGTRVYINQPPVGSAGGIPDGNDLPGVPLMMGASQDGSEVTLSWGASCVAEDTDYAIYQGTLDGDFTDHAEVLCTTAGATSRTFHPAPGNRYYLVVPHNGILEGSYGRAGSGAPRQQGSSACRPMDAESCQ